MKRAFKDSSDGYYEVDVPNGEPMPEWTKTLTPCAVIPASPPSVEQQRAAIVAAVQARLDEVPRERNYDGILSLCTYATSTIPKFAAEGQAGVEWRDACWSKCYTEIAKVEGGQRSMPTPEEAVAELPAMVWPALQQ